MRQPKSGDPPRAGGYAFEVFAAWMIAGLLVLLLFAL